MASFINFLLDTNYNDHIRAILRDGDMCSGVRFQLFQIISAFAEDKLVMFTRDSQLAPYLHL
jgi:hypothetical protein